ncbi:MAG: ACP dehydratase [Proteobacteria bacterium]|nr:ACP dehydratase [Pseudomonadota bacterium]MBU1739153.1 ACP dehydratase [Pseudomonadota bacterium]
MSTSKKIPDLPCTVEKLIPQRPPMQVAHRLLLRDRPGNFSVVEGDAPTGGIFNPDGAGVIPEYFMELMAQSMAAVNGYDSLVDGKESGKGFLVGIDDFRWQDHPRSSGPFRVEIVKDFEFGQVTVVSGKIFTPSGDLIASGSVKAWEE